MNIPKYCKRGHLQDNPKIIGTEQRKCCLICFNMRLRRRRTKKRIKQLQERLEVLDRMFNGTSNISHNY